MSALGTALVLAAGGAGALDALGVAFGLGAAVVYSAYILLADRVVGRADPFALIAIVLSVAFVAILAFSPLVGGAHPGRLDATGWLAMGGVVLVATVVPVSAFLLGLHRVGPSTSAILSTVEPAVTVGLAAAFFGERLHALQLAGGVLVLGAVVALQLRPGRSRLAGGAAADHAATAPAARPLASHAA